MRNYSSIMPVLVALAGVGILTVMDAIVKSLSGSFGTSQIVLMRFACGSVWLALLIPVLRPGWPGRDRLPAHALRAILTVVTTGSFFFALGRMPLAELFALTFTAPIFMAVFGALLLREKLTGPILIAVGLGFAGMLVIVSGGSASASTGPVEPIALAAAFAAPVTYALGMVLLRSQTAHEPLVVIILVQSLLVSALVAPLAVLDFDPIPLPTLAIFLAVGLMGAVGNLAFGFALSRMTAARFGVIDYTGLLWAAAIGYLAFGEVPRPAVWIGAGLIIAGCMIAIRSRSAKTVRATAGEG